MSTVAQLVIEMSANMSSLQRDMGKAQQLVEGAAGKMQMAAQMAMKALAGIGVGLSVAGMAAFVRGAIDVADEMSKMSQKTGLAVKDVAGMQLAYRQAGLGAEVLQSSIAKMSKSMADGSDAFTAMGLSVRNQDGTLKSTRQMIGEVSDKFAGYKDGAEKTALAMAIFGKSGAELIPLLNGGAAALDEFDSMAEKLGLTISEQTAKDAEKFNDTLDLMGQGVQGIGRQVAAQLLPTLSTLAGQFFDSATSGDTLKNVADGLGFAFKALYSTGVGVVQAFKTVGMALGGVGAAIAAILNGDFGQVKGIVSNMAADISASWQQAGAGIKTVWDGAGNSTVEALASVAKQAAKTAPEVDGAGKAAKVAADEYVKLVAKLTAKDTGFDADFAKNFQLLAEGGKKAGLSIAEIIRLQDLYIAQQPVMVKYRKDEADAEKARLEAMKALAEEVKKQIDAEFKVADAIADKVKAQEFANKTFGLSKAAIEAVTLAQMKKTLADMESSDNVLPEVIAALELQIAAQERLIDVTKEGEALDFGKKQAEEAAKAFEKMEQEAKRSAESINSSLTDALLRGFENGKGFAENFRDTLKNMFKTLVLKPIIQFALAPIAGGIQSVLGGIGFGGGGSGGGLGSLFGGFSGFNNPLSGVFNGLQNVTGNFFPGIGAGFSAARGEGGLGGAFSAAGTALGAGNISGGLGTALGALGSAMPYVGAAIALIDALKYKATPHVGSVVNVDANGARSDRGAYLAGNFSQQTDDALRYLGLGSIGSLNALDKTFGGSGANYSANIQFAADGKDASAAQFSLNREGATFADLAANRGQPGAFALYTNNAEQAFKQFTNDVQSMTLDAIKGMSSLPQYVRDAFADLGSDATLQQIGALVDQVGVFRAQIAVMQKAIGSLGSASDDALASIIKGAGGIDQFSASINSYFANFFTDSERQEFGLSQLSDEFKKLGVALPDSRQGFRDLVEGINISSAAGQSLYASLINLSDEFASLVPAVDAASAAAEAAANAAAETKKAWDDLFTNAGIGIGSISSVLRDGLTGRLTQEDLGKRLSDIVINGFNNALANGVADNITQSFTNKIIGPMLQAIATGGVVSSAVSQATINDFVAQAEAQIKLYTQVISSPAVQMALAQLNTGLNGVTSAMSGLTGSLQGVAAAAAEVNKYTANGADVARANAPWIQAAEDAERAGREAQKAWGGIGDAITDEINRIRGIVAQSGPGGEKYLEQQFNLANSRLAQNPADQEAYKELIKAGQSYIAVAEKTGSALEVQLKRGTVLQSLMVARDRIDGSAQPSSYSSSYSGPGYSAPAPVGSFAQQTSSDMAALTEQVRALTDELKAIKENTASISKSTAATADTVDGAVKGRAPFRTREVAL